MPLYKVQIIEERTSFAFVSATSEAVARAIVNRACHEGECDALMADAPVADLYPGTVREIDEMPTGYEIDFDCDESDTVCECGDI